MALLLFQRGDVVAPAGGQAQYRTDVFLPHLDLEAARAQQVGQGGQPRRSSRDVAELDAIKADAFRGQPVGNARQHGLDVLAVDDDVQIVGDFLAANQREDPVAVRFPVDE